MFSPDRAATLAVVRPGVAVGLEHLEAGREQALARARGGRPGRGRRLWRRRASAQAAAPSGSMPIAASFLDSDFMA